MLFSPQIISRPPFLGPVGIGGIDAFTQLMLHTNGVDTGTSFPDSSSAARTVTPAGNAQTSTAQFKFGSASALFDGVGDSLSIADAASLEPGSGNFTFDFWMYATASAGCRIVSKGLSGPFHIVQSGTALTFSASSDGATADVASGVSMGTIALNTWCHGTLIRNGTSLRGYVGGVAGTNVVTSATLVNTTDAWEIGAVGGVAAYTGYLDEIRYSVGVARWTTAFTPNSAPYS